MAIEKLYPPTEVAQILGITIGYTRELIRRGTIPAHRLGGQKRGFVRVRESDLEAYINARKVVSPPDPKTTEGGAGDE